MIAPRLCFAIVIGIVVTEVERAHAAPINAISNPSFETGFPDESWIPPSRRLCPSPSLPLSGHTGSCFGLVTSEALMQTFRYPEGLVPGDHVTELSLYATVESGGLVPPLYTTATLQVIVRYFDGSATYAHQILHNVDNWMLFDFTPAVSTSRTVARIDLYSIAGGPVAVDDVSLIVGPDVVQRPEPPVPEPSASVLLALGLIGLASHRNRRKGERRPIGGEGLASWSHEESPGR
jgi:hypothetical protein